MARINIVFFLYFQILFDDSAISNHPSTTNEIKECCKDIKVLGRKDLRNILSWWKVLHEEYTKSNVESKDEISDSVGEDTKDNVGDTEEKSEDELEAIDKQINELQVFLLTNFYLNYCLANTFGLLKFELCYIFHCCKILLSFLLFCYFKDSNLEGLTFTKRNEL